jgi:hypothetical protein
MDTVQSLKLRFVTSNMIRAKTTNDLVECRMTKSAKLQIFPVGGRRAAHGRKLDGIYLLTPLFKVICWTRDKKRAKSNASTSFAGQMRPKVHRMSLVVLPYRSHPQLPNVEPADKAQMALSS